MTGLDLLKEEMKKRGLNQAQCDSKTAAVVLDILAESQTTYTDLREAREETARHRGAWYELIERQRRAQIELDEVNRRINEKRSLEWLEAPEYVQEFYNAISNCETPEGKDAMKAAQMFVNTVTIDSKYDNTAFIIGLASILSQGHVGAIDELKKINNKIPSPVKWRNEI